MSVATDEQTLNQLCVNTIRTLSMDGVQKANSGHPGTPMALAPIAHVLYTRAMRHAPAHPEWADRDRFILSCGHASMLLYSVLYLTGYGLTLDDLKNFRQMGSPCAGHPEHGDAAGIETTTGPLGQGLGNGVGMALAERMLADRYNRPGHEVVDHYTYVLASDGDVQEGVGAEACSLAGHLGLGRLVVFYDDNHISIEGDTELAFSEDVGKRFEAYGWHVQDLGEDLELDRIDQAIDASKNVQDKPSLIIVRTHIAPGSPNKQDTAEAHGAPLGDEEIRLTKQAYDWPSDEPFFVPDEALEYYRRSVDSGNEVFDDWQRRFEAYRGEFPQLAQEFERQLSGELPTNWDDAAERPVKGTDSGGVATRKASSDALQWLAAGVPELVGGSADLGPSTLTLITDGGSVARDSFGNRNLHFGVREHGMGAVVNGLLLHGFRGYGSTFLIFSDYMKPAVRLAAIMKLPAIYVFTHDSIGLGEDGTTHQPIEQLATLRATPGISVVRPADYNETVAAWHHAISTGDRPTAFALSRQGVPVLDPALIPEDAIERGGYVLRDSTSGEPEVILIGTGAEVHVCLAASDLLEAKGIGTRVVSMPCMENFAAQDSDYRDSVLPPACRRRVAVEAGSEFGWHQWVGEKGAIVGMSTFGLSAPAGELFKHFGFTAENVANAAAGLS